MSQYTPAAQMTAPTAMTQRAPIRLATADAGRATTAAMNGPGVIARPASRTE
jgi:hypothetical protein